jgi:glycosyltransferase involved in cell wall biosynthesis
MTPFFSVVIPTRNRSRKIRRALASLVDQTVSDFEVLVVDDGDDDTADVVRAGFPAAIYLRGEGRGVATARNLGLARAVGTYVAFLDADDWWYPTKLERVREAAGRHPGTGLFYSRLDFVDRDGHMLWSPRVLDFGSRAYPAIVHGNFIANSTAVAKRTLLNAVDGFDSLLGGCEDWDLWIRLARRAPVEFIDESLVAIEYLSEGSITAHHIKWLQSMDEVVEKALRDDSSLRGRERQIRAVAAYVKGKICLGAKDDAGARQQFRTALRYRPWYGRALIYALVLNVPGARAILPSTAKVALRLPPGDD